MGERGLIVLEWGFYFLFSQNLPLLKLYLEFGGATGGGYASCHDTTLMFNHCFHFSNKQLPLLSFFVGEFDRTNEHLKTCCNNILNI